MRNISSRKGEIVNVKKEFDLRFLRSGGENAAKKHVDKTKPGKSSG